jgi:hypothetical protein
MSAPVEQGNAFREFVQPFTGLVRASRLRWIGKGFRAKAA